MQEFEKLGAFYLGRPYDLQARQRGEGWLLYSARDLVTHAVCVGMTGSGKTGLCLALLEEAALDGVPAIAIDPKGDIGNLLLTFPELRPSDFLPWADPGAAARAGLSVEAYAARQAEQWQSGLAEWGQDGERIRRLREAALFVVFTRGSSAGVRVNILQPCAAPAQRGRDDPDLLGERIQTTATSLLGLLGIAADPLRSREHILISTILNHAWRQGQDLDLAAIIQQIQSPPVARVGVMELDAFYPARARFELAMALNSLLAAPGFADWLAGEPLEVDRLLHTATGRPRIAIFSIAHLGDEQRMFFVSLLLNQVLGWARSQSGTSSLRAILYMDEIYGYLPPVANPPTKAPLLTLLKQARAFGLGLVLATQNPVDLDYKGLANAGTWLIGRLQTERDKARVLEGLEGAASTAGAAIDRAELDRVLSGLGSRIFLLHNVHQAGGPEVFESRWCMSYLRGPLTRQEIRTLMAPYKAAQAAGRPAGEPGAPVAAPGAPVAVSGAPVAVSGAPAAATHSAAAEAPPLLPPELTQHFLPVGPDRPAGAELIYLPLVFGAARVRLNDRKTAIDLNQELAFLTPLTGEALPVNWDQGEWVSPDLAERMLPQHAVPGRYGELPPAALRPGSYAAWGRDLAAWLHQNHRLELWRSPGLQETSRPGETEREFRIRLQHLAHERRDERAERLRAKYAGRLTKLRARLRRAERSLAREQAEAKQQHVQTALSVGATLLGAFLGRKKVSAANLGRATTAARGAGRSWKQSQDVGRAEAAAEALRGEIAELEAEFRTELAAAEAKFDPLTEPLETVAIRPAKAHIAVGLVALVWGPHWHADGRLRAAWG